jgi:hypothetical protein
VAVVDDVDDAAVGAGSAEAVLAGLGARPWGDGLAAPPAMACDLAAAVWGAGAAVPDSAGMARRWRVGCAGGQHRCRGGRGMQERAAVARSGGVVHWKRKG